MPRTTGGRGQSRFRERHLVAHCVSIELMAIARKKTLYGRWKAATRKIRELAMVGRALAFTSHPVLVQIVPARFCNLSCGYCNEYDKVSAPVPLDEMLRRIDHLGKLGTAMIGISGGEPLTHPDLDVIIRRIRSTGAIAGMITNGYLLNVDRIERLNRAGRPASISFAISSITAPNFSRLVLYTKSWSSLRIA